MRTEPAFAEDLLCTLLPSRSPLGATSGHNSSCLVPSGNVDPPVGSLPSSHTGLLTLRMSATYLENMKA